MKKKALFIVLGALLALALLVLFGGPLWVRLGLPIVCIRTGPEGTKLVSCGPQVDPLTEEELNNLPTLQASTAMPPATDAQPVIIDTDMAPDDWMAILFLLQHPGVDVKAITVSGTGETRCKAGVQNALNLANLAGKPEMPVACGRGDAAAGTCRSF